MVIFTKKFGTLDPYLPIVWDKVPKKTFFLDTFPNVIYIYRKYYILYVYYAVLNCSEMSTQSCRLTIC